VDLTASEKAVHSEFFNGIYQILNIFNIIINLASPSKSKEN